MRKEKSVCWSSSKQRRIDSYTWVAEWREVLTENNGATRKSNRYEIWTGSEWRNCRRTIYRTRKLFLLLKSQRLFADTQFTCTQPSKNITTLFDWSVYKKEIRKKSKIKRYVLVDTAAVVALTKWRNFWHFMSICVCTNCAMLSFYKWNLLKKSCNSNESENFRCERVTLHKLYCFTFVICSRKCIILWLYWLGEIEGKLSEYIGTEIQSCIMLLFYPRLRRAVCCECVCGDVKSKWIFRCARHNRKI